MSQSAHAFFKCWQQCYINRDQKKIAERNQEVEILNNNYGIKIEILIVRAFSLAKATIKIIW